MAFSYYAGPARSGIVKFAFHGATSIIADTFVVSFLADMLHRPLYTHPTLQISRLYVIWGYRKSVVVAPLLSLLGFTSESSLNAAEDPAHDSVRTQRHVLGAHTHMAWYVRWGASRKRSILTAPHKV